MPIAVSTLCALGLLLHAKPQAAMDWKAVDRVLGRSGNLQGETYRVGFPRNDLHVTVGAVTVRPALALGSWVAFKQTDDTTAMLMGDLVLVESEAGPRAPRGAIRWISSGTSGFGAGDEPPIQQEVVDDLQRPGNEKWYVDQRGL